jgi:predicted dehydrogenase
VRWGILGTGGIASTFVTDLRLTNSGVAVAVGSRSQGSADRFADEFGIANPHASYESLVADPDVDVIYVATPHPMHHDNAILALRAGKHVLVEKPFTMNAAEAREIVRVARDNGLFAMEAKPAHPQRHVPNSVRSKEAWRLFGRERHSADELHRHRRGPFCRRTPRRERG